MQFLILAYDNTDMDAPLRRAAAQPKHAQLAQVMRDKNQLLYAAYILDDEEKVIGSMRILDMPSEEAFQEWYDEEPYILEKVWVDIEIKRCSIPDLFH